MVGYDSPNQYTALLNRMLESRTNCRILGELLGNTVPCCCLGENVIGLVRVGYAEAAGYTSHRLDESSASRGRHYLPICRVI